MKFTILAVVVAAAVAAPQGGYQLQPTYSAPTLRAQAPATFEIVPILRDDRVQDDNGKYNFEVEAGNSIVFSESGSPDGPEGAVVSSGQYSYTAPDGTPVLVKYVADENGFQPESDLLPVAPEFPHPIPQFVLDQIAKAAEEDAAAARAQAPELRAAASYQAPSLTYGQPQ
ncbi:cuticle protein AMP1A-like [Procambarus clarkii]|uniref:cuticle protein AMP1A-like n=1 Tax=Procambarus clarkii TaxID=6728 RepID=UPI0037441F41